MRRVIDTGSGKGHGLNMNGGTADKASMVLTLRARTTRAERRRERQRGQALVEFALILPLFLMIVVGLIQFGVALNFWFDLQRLANQGARSAAVNCGAAENQCGSTTLVNYLGLRKAGNPDGQVLSAGNDPDVEICYVPPSPQPAGWEPSSGDAVRVRLKERYRLQAIVGLAKIDLAATATMRLEQTPDSSKLPDRTVSANWVLASHTGSQPCQP